MLYGLIGKSLIHTLSPEIHKELGCEYRALELPDENAVKEYLNTKNFLGINVTIPYKQTVIRYIDELDITAKSAGAVNTILNKRGKLIGYNTDVGGMEYALSNAAISIINKSVMIAGSGGTANTARTVAEKNSAGSIKVVSRQGNINYENCYAECSNIEVFINTTPVGMYPDVNASIINIKRFNNLNAVLDVVYNPLNTKLRYDAAISGLTCADGLDMLVEQARLSHNIFAAEYGNCGGIAASTETARIVKKIRTQKINIVLIGMSGSGKTVIGRELAKRLHREFIDVDEEIVSLDGRDIARIFKESGEDYFRRLEKQVIIDNALKSGIVISTGGGAVLDLDNRFYLKCNGAAVLIERDLNKVSLQGRPLTANLSDVKRLYEMRKDIYLSAKDLKVENNGTVAQATEEIIKLLNGKFAF